MISLSIEGPVATAVLNGPPVNAIGPVWIDDLERILDRVAAGADVSVLHVRSATRAFCAGADLSLMRELLAGPGGVDAMVELIDRLQRVLQRLESSDVVSVAEIGGAALGGGLELALACDLRVASESAKLGLPEAGLGLVPGAGGTQRLPRVCGDAIARRMILCAEVVDGRVAAELGLVQWTMPDAELVPWTRALVDRLGALPSHGLAACKRCLAAGRDGSKDGYKQELIETRKLYGDADTLRRVRDFLEKKPPPNLRSAS